MPDNAPPPSPLHDPDYTPPLEDLNAVLAFLPIFEQDGYTATRTTDSGWPVSKKEVQEFVQTLSRTRMTIVFDWPAWKDESRRLYDAPDLLAQADLLTLRKLFTTHIRANRFNEGHLAHVIENRYIVAMLHRLKTLRDELAAG